MYNFSSKGLILLYLSDLSLQCPIHRATFDATERVVNITGKPIRFEFASQLPSFALLKAARSFMNEHVIYLNPQKLTYINHIIVHECYHLFRFWSAPETDRFSMGISHEAHRSLLERWKKELRGKADLFPPSMYAFWVNGLYTFFYNALTDTRIETQIALDYPDLSSEQQANLRLMEQASIMSLSKQVQRACPSSLFLKMGALNYVFLKQLTPIIGDTWFSKFKQHREVCTLGKKLLLVIPPEDQGLLQDIQVLDVWSGLLDIQGISWVPFENVPLDYEIQI